MDDSSQARSPPDGFSDQPHHGRNENTADECRVRQDIDPGVDPKGLDKADLRQAKSENVTEGNAAAVLTCRGSL
jgi:hypothetical protein